MRFTNSSLKEVAIGMPKTKKGRGRKRVGGVKPTPGSIVSPIEESRDEREKQSIDPSSSEVIGKKSSDLFLALQDLLSSYVKSNPECAKYAPSIEKYMRSQFPFFGIKSPPRRTMLKEFVERFDKELHQFDSLSSLLCELWEGDKREFQSCGVDLMEKFKDVLLSEGFDEAVGVVKHCLVTKSWWDTVDAISYPGSVTHLYLLIGCSS